MVLVVALEFQDYIISHTTKQQPNPTVETLVKQKPPNQKWQNPETPELKTEKETRKITSKNKKI